MPELSKIKGLLFDLDGVLYIGSQLIEGAVEAVEKIRHSDIQCRFITNTSTLSRNSLQQKLSALGFAIPADEIISAPQAVLLYLQQQHDPVCHLLLADDVKNDFAHIRQSNQKADFIIIGDIGDAWSYHLLNKVFNQLLNGAKLIAIHKNKFWQTEQGMQMDIGGFIAALEYASGQQATIIGKPSPAFFHSALQDINLPSKNIAIIGDDIDSDIGGAQAVGLNTILVKTGKYRQAYTDQSAIRPDVTIESVAQLPALLNL